MLSCNIPGVDISDFCSLKLYSMREQRDESQVAYVEIRKVPVIRRMPSTRGGELCM